MNKIIKLLFPIIILSISGTSPVESQSYFSKELGEFQGNKIHTFFNPAGDKFWDREYARFQVPFTGENSPSVFFASNTWVGGYDETGTLRLSAQRYVHEHEYAFTPGPLILTDTVSHGIYDSLMSKKFDRVWKVSRNEVLKHQADFDDNGIIDDPIESIFGWPASGNTHFINYYGFSLPQHNGGWAEYFDVNENGFYDPENGDYPHIQVNGKSIIPDDLLWLVFNDVGGVQNENDQIPIQFEFQLSAYALNCKDLKQLNQTVFTRYKVINQSGQQMTEVRIGDWMDPDLGCYTDDYLGTDSLLNTYFFYNEDGIDGTVDDICATFSDKIPTYGSNPPVSSFTYLNQELFSAIASHSNQIDGVPQLQAPQSSVEYYRYLNAQWRDGTPLTQGGNGYNPGTNNMTNYIFNGNIIADEWNMYYINIFPFHEAVTAIRIPFFQKDSAIIIDGMYSFHQDSMLNNVETVGLMKSNVADLQAWYNNGGGCAQESSFCDSDCVWPGDFNTDGIVDHVDLLYLGVGQGSEGPSRNELMIWRGHFSEEWATDIPSAKNLKHVDGNGDGALDTNDLKVIEFNFAKTNQNYKKNDEIKVGDDFLLTSTSQRLDRLNIEIEVFTGQEIKDLYGLAFTLDYDTAIFNHILIDPINPFDEKNSVLYDDETQNRGLESRYAATKLDGQNTVLPKDFQLAKFRILNINFNSIDLPDSTTIQLKNIVGLDQDGNKLNLGSQSITLLKQMSTSTNNHKDDGIKIYPNPAKHTLNLQSAAEPMKSIKIFDVVGKKVIDLSNIYTIRKQIDLSTLNAGLYIITIETVNGQSSRKLVVE